MAGLLTIDDKLLGEGIQKAAARLHVCQFSQKVRAHGRAASTAQLEKIITSTERGYGVYAALMESALKTSAFLEGDVTVKKAVNFYALYLGAAEGAETLEEGNGNGNSPVSDSIPLTQCGFGMGRPQDYAVSLDSLIQHQLRVLSLGNASAIVDAQKQFFASVRRTIETELAKQTYASIREQLNGMHVKIKGHTYRGFSREQKGLLGTETNDDQDGHEVIERLDTVAKKRYAGDGLTKPEHYYIAGAAAARFKEQIHRDVQQRLAYDETYSLFLLPKDVLRPYLLVGPPGTGKTTLVRSYAAQSGLAYWEINCADLGSELQHKTSKNLLRVYREACAMVDDKKIAGAILFFDEIDHLLKPKMLGQNMDSNEVASTAQTILQGIETDPRILVVGTTNRPDLMEQATRERFKIITIGYPETDDELIEIHRKIIEKREDYARAAHAKRGRTLNRVFNEFSPAEYNALLQFSRADETYKSGRTIERVLVEALKYKLAECASGKLGKFEPVSAKDVFDSYRRFEAEKQYDAEHREQQDAPRHARAGA